ncbi:calcium/proton exchanger [Russula emetica]|nr:calcium/proton exchanger [Russula emetica]
MPLGEAPGVRESITAIIKTSWLNALLIFIPLSWIFHYVCIILFFAAWELLTGIIALAECELSVVQSYLVGSILRNLLLVLGTCFFASGIRFSVQGFGIRAIHLDSSLLALSVIAMLIPAAFHNSVQPWAGDDSPITNQQEGQEILSVSHSVFYLCYLIFQLFSHKNIYDDSHPDVQQSAAYPFNVAKRLNIPERKIPPTSSSPPPTVSMMDPDQRGARSLEAGLEEEGEIEELKMGLQTTIVLLIVVTVLVALTAGFLVDSIDGLTSSHKISKWFVGLILLPNVGNAADHVFITMGSVKRISRESLGAAVGSSIQIMLFVFPFIVILGWILGKPLTFLFDPFQSIVLFLSVLTVNRVLQDGTSNWLKGMILICLYAIIAVTFWYYPVSDPAGILSSCK